jgi:glycosyltransferase
MKISIITVCYNSSATILDTLTSVQSQDYGNVEHIIVDGASTDNTLDLIKRFKKGNCKFISEKDNGIYDAMNKGISLASGDVIGFLNADDVYQNSDVLTKIIEAFLSNNIDAVYGDLVYVDQNNLNNVKRYWKSGIYKKGLFIKGWMPAHPTFYVKKDIYNLYGGFKQNFVIAADFELTYRFIERNCIKLLYIPNVLVRMRLGGTTNKNIKNVLKQNSEIIKLLRNEFQDFSIIAFVYTKIINRLFQFLRGFSLN